jgi:hypothetical protein
LHRAQRLKKPDTFTIEYGVILCNVEVIIGAKELILLAWEIRVLLFNVQETEGGLISPCRKTADAAVLVVGETRVKCTVIEDDNGILLVPQAGDPDSLLHLTEVPITAHLEWNDGSTRRFKIERTEMLGCIFGSAESKKFNRRRSRRVKVEFRVAISLDGEDWRFANGLDISRGGMLMVSPGTEDLQMGAQIQFRIHLPDNPEVVAGCAVIVRKKTITQESGDVTGLGARFTHMRMGDSHRLSLFLQDTLANSPKDEDTQPDD